jgi:integrase
LKSKSLLRREDKICPICNYPKSYSNFAVHVRACKNKERIKNNEIHQLKETNQILNKKIEDLESKNYELQSLLNIQGIEPYTFDDFLNDKSYGTKGTYTHIWNRYIKWCKDKKIEPKSIYFARLYFNEIKSLNIFKQSTLNLIRSVMINLFNKIYSIDLSKFFPKQIKFYRLDIKPKYVMSVDEIKAFISELISDKNLNNFLSFYLLIFSGCRIHSLAMLTPKSYSDGELKMVDYKTGKTTKFELTKVMKNVMNNYIDKNSNNNFLFFSQDLNINSDDIVSVRGKYLSMRTRRIMLKSNVFRKVNTKEKSIGPHIFRTTKVQQVMSEIKEKVLEQCRKAINHTQGTQSIYHYLPKDFDVSLYSNLITEIDNIIMNDSSWTTIK